MADFATPVRIPRAAFDQLLARIDDAVSEHGVALGLHEDFPFRELDPVSATAIDFSGIDIEEDPLEIVENLDQLLYFAFDFAPPEVIVSWVDEYDSDLKDEAIARVEAIRNNMPHLGKLWRAKSNSLVPPLIEFAYDVVNSDSDETCAYVYLAASRINSTTSAPDKSDVTRMRIQLWPSDVRVLARELGHLWHAHLAASSEHTHEEDLSDAGDKTDS